MTSTMQRWHTPIGSFDVRVGEHGVSSICMPDETQPLPELDVALTENLTMYFNGGGSSVAIDLGSVSSPLAQLTLAKLLEIPYGEIRPYAWVAKEIGSPRAIRAVASAVARNPVPVLVPCHRVVRSDGHIGEFSLGGPAVKHALLRHEGVDIERVEDLATRHVRFIADAESNIFHLPTCHHGPAVDSASLVEIKTAAHARDRLMDACKHCRPV